MARKRMLPTYDLGEFDLEAVELIHRATQGDFYEVEGSLIANYLIDVEGFPFRYGVRRKWLVVDEEFETTQSSTLHAFLTNDEKIAEEFKSEEKLFDQWRNEEISDDEYDKRTQGFSGRWYPTLAAIRQKNAEKFFAQFQR